MAHSTPKPTPSASAPDLIACSKTLLDRFNQELNGHKNTLGPTALKDLEARRASLSKLLALSEGLHSADITQQNSALLEALGAFPKALEKYDAFQLADSPALRAEALAIAKTTATNNLGAINHEFETIISKIAPKTSSLKMGEELAERSPGLFSRLFQKHNALLDKKSPTGKFGIMVTEMVVGSVLMDVGSRWISQSVTGLKEGAYQQSEGPSNGSRTSTLILVPMSKQERVLKAALGSVGVGAGLAGTVLGFSGLLRM